MINYKDQIKRPQSKQDGIYWDDDDDRMTIDDNGDLR